ncbi:amino acid adenylation domain-containing protein [Methanomassiliicoccales archaeon LGM-RCC1]|nr:amino acid adenylation domain-containing protein [Methanomassiliicoccales archaeon LGM-RCC1]
MREDPTELCVYETDGDKSYSNSEFLAMIGRCTNYLKDGGILRKDVVVINTGRSALHFAFRYACMNIGAIYFSLDPSVPEQRAEMMIASSGAKLVIRRDFSLPEGLQSDFEPEVISDNEPAFIVFTSGSTGTPKGVLQSRECISNLVETQIGTIPLKMTDKVGTISSVSFIVSNVDLYPTFNGGASLYIIDDALRGDIPRMRAFLDKVRLDYMILIPRYYDALGRPSSIRNVVFGGDKAGVQSRVDGVRLFNSYGLSEGLICIGEVTNYNLDPPLGEPPAGSSITVEDEDGNPADVGEIVCRGRGLLLGYLDDMSEGYPETPIRVLHTGDIGKRMEDGIHILGRIGEQVKINGHRVEPAETRYAMSTIDGVDDAAVAVFHRPDGSPYLCGFYTGKIEPEKLRGELMSKIDSYLVPRRFVRMDSLPRNSNGKVDMHALPEPDQSTLLTEYVAPSNDAERTLCEAFSEVFGIEGLGVDDDFIRLGGDSLRAIKLSYICRDHGLSVSIADILSRRTPRALAASSGGLAETLLYTLETGCPLTGGALDVYLDIVSGRSDAPYIVSLEHPIPKGVRDEDARAVIGKLLEVYPILTASISDKSGEPRFVFGSVPEVTVSKERVHDIRRPFILSDSLARFNIVSGDCIQAAFHHTISDGFSIMVLNEALEKLFSGLSVEADIGFLRDASSYADFDIKGSLEFFRGLLDDIYDIPEPVPDPNGASGHVGRSLTSSVKQVAERARSLGTTPANLLTSAFGYTLSRFTGSSKALFGTIVNGRDITGSLSSVGMFARTLPLVVDCHDRSVAEFLRETNDTIISVISNQRCPFHAIASEFGMDFSVVFNHLSGLETVRLEDREIVADISFDVFVSGDTYNLSCTHSQKYTDDTVQRMAETFDRIVAGLIGCERLSDIGYTSEEELDILDSISDTAVPLKFNDITKAFRQSVSEHADRTLLTYLDHNYTYSEVDRISDSIASALVGQGVTSGDSVAVMVPRSEWYLLGALGVLKTGAAYVPIDTSYPDERVSFMLSDSFSKAVICTAETRERCKSLSEIPIVSCDEVKTSRFGHKSISPTDTAVILYTSGTTGTPKGSLITHLAVENYSEFYSRATCTSPDHKVALYHSFGFDVHLESMFSPIISGASVEIIPEDVRLDLDLLYDYVTDHRIDNLHLPTVIGRMFAEKHPECGLRYLVVGGEKFMDMAVLPDYPVMEKYGPTEATVSVTYQVLDARTYTESVGIPIQNTAVYLLDAEHRRVPIGAVAELYLSGYQLSSGYLNNPQREAEVFFDNPFCKEKGYERMYATGDFFRLLPDGTLGIIGRRDGQVKIRGNRVELTEVESCIRMMEGIDDVTVQPIVQDDGSKELCAYIVTSPSSEITAEQIRAFVSERKPDYMAPSFVVVLDSIPLNVNGKVDRHALPEPNESQLIREFVAPRNNTEKALCDSFSVALGIDRIGIEDDFIRLGGDSLKAVKAVSACRSFGLEIKVSDILGRRTPKSIASSISHIHTECIYTLETGCPLTGGSLDIYLDVESGKSDSVYVINTTYPVPEGISDKQVLDAISALIGVHPVLRSRIVIQNGEPWFAVDAKPLITVSDLPVEDIRRPFELSESLSRFHIVSGKYVQAAFHHTISDGLTSDIVGKSLESILNGIIPDRDVGFLKDASLYASSEQSEEFFIEMLSDTEFTLTEDLEGEIGFGHVTLSQPLERIIESARSLGTTPANLLCAAFGYTLSKFAGTSDAVFTHIVNGRDLTGSENSAGMLVRTLPLALDCKDRTVKEFVTEASERIFGTVANQLCPFHRIVNDLNIRFGIVFNHLTGVEQHGDAVLSGMKERDVIGDLTFNLIQSDESYILAYVHSSKYSESTVQSMVRAFDLVLSGFMSCSHLSEIRYVTSEDLDKLDSLNDTARSLRFNDILEAFSHSVSEYPERRLLSYLDRSYTYSEVDRVTDSIAAALRASGVNKGDNVAVLVPRSEWYLLCSIGALKTGAAYVPIDTSYPDERASFMIDDSSAKAILCVAETMDRASRLSSVTVICCSECADAEFEPVTVSPEDAAIVLYTSGTTGQPKGAVIGRRALINLSEWYVSCTDMVPDDVYSFYTAYTFDMHALALYPVLVCGASLDIVPEDIRLDMHVLNDHFVKAHTTHTFMTTHLGRMLAELGLESDLRVLFVAGEKLGKFDASTPYQVVDGYGPTESLALVTQIPVNDKKDPSSVGRFQSNIKGYILDAEHRRVPVGAVGQLFLSGYQLSSGYLNAPERNAEAFFSNPFCKEKGYERMYATGDFFRLLPDGTLGIMGRRDGQVKVRGNRVELTEVESCIRSMEGIDDVTVQPIIQNDGSKELCAYIAISSSAPSVPTEQVRSFVSERKPDYMVPSFVVVLDRIPLNVNGKVDKSALPKPDVSELKAEFTAPGNDTEKALCEAFSVALGIDRIGIDDDFIRLGGDSLKAVKAVSVCRSSGMKILVSDILTKRTPRAIAASSVSAYTENIYSLETGCPLTGGSLDVYLDIESGRSDSVYIIDATYPMPEGTTDNQALEAISTLLDVHPVLRSRITVDKGEPWFSIDSEPQITVSDSPVDDVRRPFELSESLSRFHIVSGKYVQAAFHHTISDGLTSSIIGKSLESILNGIIPDQDVGFLKDASLYASSEQSEEFFSDMLSDTDFILTEGPDGHFGTGHIILSESLDRIVSSARSLGTTPANLLCAAFGYTLSRFSGTRDAVFTHTVNGRDLTGSEGSAGMFVRTLPLALDCRDRTVGEFVSEASERIFGTISNQLCTFHSIAKNLGIGFGVVFNHLTGVEQYGDAVSSEMKESDIIGDLTFNLIQSDGSYILAYVHSSRYSEGTVQRMAHVFDHILSGFMSCSYLSEIGYTSAEDLDILDSINRTAVPLNFSTVLDAFRHSVSEFPDRALLSYMGRRYTYAEVDRITDSIASSLAGQGVGIGDRVAIVVPRSQWYLLCALGVMKAGASYIPIDTSYPDERISFMIDDSSAKVVLCTSEIKGRCESLTGRLIIGCDGIQPSEFKPMTVQPTDVALILYTSGTTGRPKGTLISHRAVENISEWTAYRFSQSSEDVLGMHSSFGFDAHLNALFAPFLTGSAVDIVPEESRLDIDSLYSHIEGAGISGMFLSTQLGKLLIEKHPEVKLRNVILGGEALGKFGVFTDVNVIDGYGPTENTACTSSISVSERNYSSSVGIPNMNSKVYILDSERRRVPVGAVGELYVSGYQLSSGYLNNPEKNSEVFLDNPFCDEEGYERMYATGDFFRLLPDGTLGIIGRRDGQVKIRGNRVEPTEVEACIRSMEGIGDVIVQSIVQNDGSKELCAYVVLHSASGQHISGESVRSYVAERKPDYMVPSFVIILEKIPLNVNGKVDMSALPKPDISSLRKEYTAPRNDIEKVLCDAFSSALGIEGIGIDDDFMRLGGDSLKAIRAVSSCRSQGIEIKAKDVVSLRTVRAISSTVSSAADMGSSVGNIGEIPIHSIFLKSGTADQRDTFVQHMDLLCPQSLDEGILQHAIDAVTDRHDMLRAIYDGRPRIRDQGIRVCDVTLVEAFSEDDILSSSAFALSTLSLSEGRLMACLLISYEGRRYIRLMINHIAVDGVSWNIILSDLSECISAAIDGREPSLPPRTMPIRDWIARGYQPTESERRYWDKVKIDANVPELESEPFSISLPLSAENRYGIGKQDILLTAFAESFKDITGTDLVLRMEGHGRDHDVERTVGWFTCMYPLVLSTTGDPVRDVFSVRKARRSVPKGGRGYGYLRNDLPPITFNYLSSAFSYSDSLLEAVRLPISYQEPPDMGELLSFNIAETDDGLIISGRCPMQLPIFETIKNRLGSILQALAESLSAPLSGPQLNVYLDEMANDKGTAYSAPGMFPIPEGASDDDILHAIDAVLDAHPVLSMHISEVGGEPWLVPGNRPIIEKSSDDEFLRPFNFSESLCRFRIVPGYIQWNVHHVIMDAESRRILIRDLGMAFEGVQIPAEYGFLTSAADQPDADYQEDALSYYDGVIEDIELPVEDGNGVKGSFEMPIPITSRDIPSGMTAGGFFTAVFGYTLSRFTGSTQAVFPMTEKGRNAEGTEDAVGMFVNTFPVSIDCSDRPVSEFLNSSMDSILSSMSHSKVPFMDVAGRYGLTMKVSFEFLADINSSIRSITSAASGDSSGHGIYSADWVSDLAIYVTESNDGFMASLEHSGRYSQRTCERFLHAFNEIAKGLIACERLSDIQYTSSEDIDILDSINDTAAPLRFNNILEAFRHSVSEYPDRTLLTYMDRSYTYTEVDVISDSIATTLKSSGVIRGDNVAIMVPRSEWYLICAIGVMKTGAAYVPIDISYPDERISHMLNDSSSKAVVVTGETKERCGSLTGLPTVGCEGLEPSHFTPVSVLPTDTAVILYTSGTTGKPKGSKIPHQSLENFSEWTSSYTDFKSGDVFALFASVAFDMHTMSLYPPIFTGGSVDIVPEDIRLDIHRLNEHFVSRGVTHTFITTNLGKMFASSVKASTLRCLAYGGEKLGEFTAPDFIGALETYGPSENLAVSAAIPVNERAYSSSVGHLIQNVKGYILDADHRRVPVGAVGELFLSGYQLSSGYLNNPERNAEAFFGNPFSDEKGYERMYATGDFFRLLPDGTLGVIGRRDGQVKIRGNRVELTEVEACIKAMSGITGVTVQPIASASGTKELCAYVVASSATSVSDIQKFVSERKPDYMVPSFVIKLDRIPLTVNGKVDKRALPEPDLSVLSSDYSEPRDEDERILCRAFAEALGLERAGIDDDFQRLGGDSLKATWIASIFNEKSGKHVFARDIMRKRTVRAILSEQEAKDKIQSFVYDMDKGHPPSFSQMDVIKYMLVSNLSLNIATMVTLPPFISFDMVYKAVEALIQTTPDLRMHMIAKSERDVTVRYDAHIDIETAQCDPEEFAKTFVRPFTPFGPCLSRFAVVEWEGQCTLFIDICHLAFDGRSIAPLAMRIQSIMTGTIPPIDDGVIRQAGYDNAYMLTETFKRRAAEFLQTLEGSDDTYDDGVVSEDDSGVVQMPLSISAADMKHVTQKLNCGPADVFYMAEAYALNRVYGKDKMFYIIEDGRGEVDVEDSVGVFMRLHPIWITKDSDDLMGYVESAVKQVDRTLQYLDIPLLPIFEARPTIYPDVVIQFENYKIGEGESEGSMGGGLAARQLPALSRSPFRMHSVVVPHGDGFAIGTTYAEYQSGKVVNQIVMEFDGFLSELAEHIR